MRAELAPGKEGSTIRFSWKDATRADERVYWDFEVTDRGGRVVQSLAGTGIGTMGGHDWESRDFGGLAPNTTRCFRVRARTEPGTQGCVSKLWSGKACATTAAAPATPPKTAGGHWGALAADGKGHWGYAVGYPSEAEAKDAAVKGCGVAECKLAIAGQANCIAYYESRQGGYWYGLALHSSQRTALTVARSGCTKGAPAGSCKLVKALCAK